MHNMAEKIQLEYEDRLKTCEFRLASGLYLPALHSYHQLLTRYGRNDPEAPEYYREMMPLIAIVRSESYIRLSPDAAVRELYLSVVEAADSLYGAFMDVAR